MLHAPVLIIRADLRWHLRIREDGEVAIGLWGQGCALNILIASKADVHWRIAHSLEQLCAWMLVEHPFAKRPKLLPLVAAIL